MANEPLTGYMTMPSTAPAPQAQGRFDPRAPVAHQPSSDNPPVGLQNPPAAAALDLWGTAARFSTLWGPPDRLYP